MSGKFSFKREERTYGLETDDATHPTSGTATIQVLVLGFDYCCMYPIAGVLGFFLVFLFLGFYPSTDGGK